ncbi:MAG: ATP-binding protein [Solirubrobacteraceae bacterium]
MFALLERDRELERLSHSVDLARGGRGSLVLVSGEAGIGKTSLMRALRERERERAAILTGACEPLSVPVPLGPVRELFAAAGAGDLAALGSDDRLALAMAVRTALAARAPVVAIVEDVHWADPLTLDLLRILARRIEELGIALVVSYRDDELDAHPALGLLLGDLAGGPFVERISLRPLSKPAVQELAGPSGLDARELMLATGGNPFLVVESIVAGSRLPASVKDAAMARVGRLGAAAREAVDAAAVIGHGFDAALVDAIAPGAGAALDEAQARGVLLADGPLLTFRHELIREAIESSISAQRRAALHARAVDALATRPRGVDHARLAHHAELAGRRAQAAGYARLAAGDAERVGALREVHLQAARALRLGDELDASERFELLISYAIATNFSSPDLDAAVRAAEQATALADELGDRILSARAAVALAATLWSLERVIEARAAVERAITALDGATDEADLASAYATLARMDATAFDPATAKRAAERALELSRRVGLPAIEVDASISLGLAAGHGGDPGAVGALLRALEIARDRGLSIQTIRTYVNLAFVAAALRDHARVDQAQAEALPLMEELHAPMPAMSVRLSHARSLLDRGCWPRALAFVAGRDRSWQGELPVARAMAGLIAARRGQPDAEELLNGAWEQLWEIVPVESSRHGMLRLALVEAAWLAGDQAAMVARLREARDSPAVPRFARSAAELALWGARVGVQLPTPACVPAAVALELEGDWRGAIDAWRLLEAPYEASLAALPGDERAAREALATLHRLGAKAAARAFGRERVARGARPARGPRRSTLAHPAGLTRREQEVLERLATGATDAAIAAELHLSQRTVSHHVAAILRKLDATNRRVAVDRARTTGLL